MSEIIFYTNPMSRGRTVRWMLEEVGCDYKQELLDFGPNMKSKEFLAINPMGKVPALKHDNAIITETVAICTYLADAFPKAGLLPKTDDTKARADYFRWLFFLAGPFEAAVFDKYNGLQLEPKQQGMVGYGNIDLVISTFDTAVKGKKYIAGNHFTTVDLIATASLSFYMYMDMIPKLDSFQTYVSQHRNRPAYVKAASIDDQLIKK